MNCAEHPTLGSRLVHVWSPGIVLAWCGTGIALPVWCSRTPPRPGRAGNNAYRVQAWYASVHRYNIAGDVWWTLSVQD
ncbi:hypothetical protein HOY82DRAFT_571053 [Tuber indicum]|nr:hypothetical protein HOY82DRAFT_571053 [Tuber indicum]